MKRGLRLLLVDETRRFGHNLIVEEGGVCELTRAQIFKHFGRATVIIVLVDVEQLICINMQQPSD